MELEEEFDINIPDDAAEKIQKVGEAIEFIEQSSILFLVERSPEQNEAARCRHRFWSCHFRQLRS